MQMKYRLNNPGKPAGLLRKLVALVVTGALFALVLMFSAVLFVIILVAGTIAGAYLWWKTRKLRKMMRDLSSREERREMRASNDEVLEGEVIRVVDPRDAR